MALSADAVFVNVRCIFLKVETAVLFRPPLRSITAALERGGGGGRAGGEGTYALQHSQTPLRAPQGGHQVLLVILLAQVLHTLFHCGETHTHN